MADSNEVREAVVANENVVAQIQDVVSADLDDSDQEQVEQVFEQLIVDALTEEQANALVIALQEASPKIKKAFEKHVDVFSGQFDEYVPNGSVISVAERRVVSGVTAVLFVLPTPVPVGSRRL